MTFHSQLITATQNCLRNRQMHTSMRVPSLKMSLMGPFFNNFKATNNQTWKNSNLDVMIWANCGKKLVVLGMCKKYA